jgi:hypothetical protein
MRLVSLELLACLLCSSFVYEGYATVYCYANLLRESLRLRDPEGTERY